MFTFIFVENYSKFDIFRNHVFFVENANYNKLQYFCHFDYLDVMSNFDFSFLFFLFIVAINFPSKSIK